MNSKKRRRKDVSAKRAAKAVLRENRVKLDSGAYAVRVDPSKLGPDNSYSEPEFVKRGYYVDLPFVCQGCDAHQVWTATQQKWWYEVAQGGVWTTARLCRACRRRERALRAEKSHGGDPNRYKSWGQVLARIRTLIEPGLLELGYRLAGRERVGPDIAPFLDYRRAESLLTISWNARRGRFVAEILREGAAEVKTVATVRFSAIQSTAVIDRQSAPFVAAVLSYVESLRD